MFRLSIDTIVGFSLACNILILIEVVSSGSAWLVKETLFQVLDEGTFKETKVVSASEPPLYIAKSTGSEFKISKEAFNWAPVIKSLNGKFTKPTRHFSGEFKLKVLNYQQEHNLSNSQVALLFGITSKGTISAWRKKYITGGTKALFQKQGRRSKMPKKSLIPNKPREEWTKDEELAYLRMENEYLKKLTALIQEDKQREKDSKNKKSESSKN